MSPSTPTLSSERALLTEIIQHPEILETLDKSAFDLLALGKDTRLHFFTLIANPMLNEIPFREGIRIAVEADGEDSEDELHLHVECEDLSPLLITEIAEADELSVMDLLDDEGAKRFFGRLAKAIQTANQQDKLAVSEQGKKNHQISLERKKELLSQVTEQLIQKAKAA